jgi:AraC-like DNA-binding protein
MLDAPDREARFAMLDRWLLHRLSRVSAPPRETTHALHLLRHRRDLDIAEIARTVGWSRRHLTRSIERTLGVGPRSYRRLLRFQDATRLAQSPVRSWADIASQAGYADQAHLTREFREFAGLTPTTYAARLLDEGGGLIEG